MEEQRALAAAKDGDLAALEGMLEGGGLGPGVADALGAGLVHHAARAGRLDCLKFLVQRARLPGGQRAHNGATPAHDAAATGHLAELCWLIRDGGCGLQDQDASGVSPLHLAARFGHPAVVEWLLREGHAAALQTLEGAWPLHHAAVSGDLTCLKLLVAAHGSGVNSRTRSGASPLYLACQEGHLHLAQFLVKDCGADVHLRALDGMSALHAAAARGHYSLVVWLVTFTDIGLTAMDNEGATALHFAARGGHTPILDRLLLMGAPVMRDSWGGTPLHDAAENGQTECCQTLVSHHVDPALRDEDGYTAADLAEYHGHPTCAQYLRAMARQVPLLPPPPPPPLPLPALSAARQALEDGRTGAAGPGSPSPFPFLSAAASPCLTWPHQPDQPLPREQPDCTASPGTPTTAEAVPTGAQSAAGGDTPDGLATPQLDGLPSGGLEGLVPTWDECGRLLPEWKRQVMAWRLQVCLGSEGHPRTQDGGGGPGSAGQAAWLYSRAHRAVLGPFGELLTEDDLAALDRQIADLQLRRCCRDCRSELGRLAAELQALLPAPLAGATVRSHFPPRAPGPGTKEGEEAAVAGVQALPVSCGHVVRLALLLRGADGLARDEDTTPLRAAPRKPPSGPPPEVQECGVSVRTLCSNFERAVPPCLPRASSPGPGRQPGDCRAAPLRGGGGRGPGPVDTGGSSALDLSRMDALPEAGLDVTNLRKERVLTLFLGHWKASASGPAPGATTNRSLEAPRAPQPPSPPPRGDPRLGRLWQQRSTVAQLLGSWKSVLARVPARQLRRLRRQPHGLLSPEQFLPHVDGAPVPYGRLSLDLFLLGYFRLLECDLPPEERAARHRLCFEVFEQLDVHGWEAVRAFHKAVTDEVAAGRRAWTDGFGDIRARFFGAPQAWDSEPGRRGDLGPLEPPPPGPSPRWGGLSSEDVCGVIHRSFAFWKEKEAEMFDLGE
ncbi:espin-like protein [Tamandua tetradactyla]|uniref:espin-like protein n=1 Tax=Tamandua tetradactyla TaxID=48850 RepID=UPI004053F599